MNAQRTAISLLLIFLLFAVTACGSSNAEPENVEEIPTSVPDAVLLEVPESDDENTPSAEENSSENNEEPGDVADEESATNEEPADNSEEEMEAPILALNAENNYGIPDSITSFRTSVFFESTETLADGTQTISTITVEGSRDVAGDKSTFTATASGAADFGSGQLFSFTEIEGVTYFILPDGNCATFSGETPGDDLYGLFYDDGGFLGELNATDLGMPPIAEVNGVDTYHYVFDETNLNPNDPDTADISTVEGDIYVARDGGYIVQAIITGIGQNSLLNDSAAESQITYEINYFDFNQPVDVAIPEGCGDVAESEYPVLDDAYEINALPGVYSYLSNVDVATAVAFYQTEMSNAGWTETSNFSTAEGGLISFSKDGEMVQIAIGQEGEGVSIGILGTP
ncbi:MAG: hypothetical protein GY943_05085 [Chloroflexi bacterium]|nr:hypothetical protein [Chloroflexota bacterium]